MKNRTAENGSKKKKKVQEKLTFTSFTYYMIDCKYLRNYLKFKAKLKLVLIF